MQPISLPEVHNQLNILGSLPDNAKFINCMFLDHYEESHPIYIDNGKRGGDFINCLIDAGGIGLAFFSNGYPSLMNCTVFNYMDYAYYCSGSGSTIINSVFLQIMDPDANVALQDGVQDISFY